MSAGRRTIGAVVSAGACAFGALLVCACGDVYADPDPEPLSEQADASVFGDGSEDFGRFALVRCPLTRPRENSACSLPGSACEYGQSADPACNTTVACEGASFEAAWVPRQNAACFADACPASGDVASLEGKPCTLDVDGAPSTDVTDADEAVCNMSDGVCACTTGPGGPSAHARRWVCVRPISDCPPSRPALGSPCEGSLWCDYGSCAYKRGSAMECIEGNWLMGGASCE